MYNECGMCAICMSMICMLCVYVVLLCVYDMGKWLVVYVIYACGAVFCGMCGIYVLYPYCPKDRAGEARRSPTPKPSRSGLTLSVLLFLFPRVFPAHYDNTNLYSGGLVRTLLELKRQWSPCLILDHQVPGAQSPLQLPREKGQRTWQGGAHSVTRSVFETHVKFSATSLGQEDASFLLNASN